VTDRPRDLPLGVITLAVSAAYYWSAANIPPSDLADSVGPQGLPKAYAAVLGLLSLALIARALAARRNTRSSFVPPSSAPPSSAQPRTDHRVMWRATGMLLIGVVYVVLVPYLGYLLTIAGLIVATTAYQSGVLNRRIAAVGVSGAIVLWVLFVVLLGIPQPAGVWPSILPIGPEPGVIGETEPR
jgi:putative tricarboxylic transport membrane protein